MPIHKHNARWKYSNVNAGLFFLRHVNAGQETSVHGSRILECAGKARRRHELIWRCDHSIRWYAWPLNGWHKQSHCPERQKDRRYRSSWGRQAAGSSSWCNVDRMMATPRLGHGVPGGGGHGCGVPLILHRSLLLVRLVLWGLVSIIGRSTLHTLHSQQTRAKH